LASGVSFFDNFADDSRQFSENDYRQNMKRFLFSTLLILVSYTYAIAQAMVGDSSAFNAQQKNEDSLVAQVQEFVKRLSSGQSLASMMNKQWSFMYHEDNRSDGSTNGWRDSLADYQIDSFFTVKVLNNGDSWDNDKREPHYYEIYFSLKNKVLNWDRFEIAVYSRVEEQKFYILGAGESDFLILHYALINDKFLITKLEYRSEDPG
jgi:hypothetical protein